MNISIIVPTLNEHDRIETLIRHLRALEPQAQIIIADASPTDQTRQTARRLQVEAVSSEPGRGRQCNAGARLATGDILLFLHADTTLPQNAFHVIRDAFADPDIRIARFRLRFDNHHPVLRFYGYFTRFDTILTRFGDQGVAVRRTFFDALGGFPDWPLFEDVHFMRLARRRTRIVSLPATVTTSARRYERNGMIRQQVLNAGLILQYWMGTPPEVLAARYQQKGKR